MIPPNIALALRFIRDHGVRLRFNNDENVYEILDENKKVDSGTEYDESLGKAVAYCERKNQK